VKKAVLVVLLFTAVLAITACGGNSLIVDEQDPVVKNGNMPPISIEDVPLSILIDPPDVIGNIYMNATYTNNSNYPITGYDVVVLLKDENEKAYLASYDTVLPGETSPIFNTFGPMSQNVADIEILAYTIIFRDENNETIYIEYDTKLDEYQWY
jgi:hypothetical protein